MKQRFLEWILIVVIILVAACASAPEPQVTRKQQLWPEPPALPRFVHEATLRSSADVQPPPEQDKMRSMLTGQNSSQPPQQRMLKPHSIAVKSGRIYVTDTRMNRLHVFDLARRRYFMIGYRFEGTLADPRGVAVDDQGKIYVVDTGSNPKRVVIYDAYGLFVRSIRLDSSVAKPTGIAVTGDGNRVYLVDTGGVDSNNHRVLVFDAQGKLVTELGKRGAAEGEFNLPVDVAVDQDDRLYVLDAGNFRVQVFENHQFVRSWGKVGRSLGDFARPRSITSDASGNTYVSDAQFTNIQIFNPQGQLLLPLGKRGGSDEDGLLSLIAGITVDETGRLYVLDQRFPKIEVYRPLSETEGKKLQIPNRKPATVEE